MMKRLTVIVFCLLSIAAIVNLTGCGKDSDPIVARVGDREIHLNEIHDFFDRAGARFISADAELQAKRDYLDSLINQHLLIIGAYENNMENEDEVVKVVEGEEIKFLLDVLFEQEILSKATPSEAELKDWYVRTGEEIKASHILVDSLATAREVLDKLKAGEIFEELAMQYSIDRSVRRNQGDLGWFTWGSMVDNFQEAAFDMQPGEISAPVKTDYGYHIIKIVDRRKIEHRPSYGELKGQIRNMIIERRKRQLMQDYAAELEKKYPITVEEPTCQFVLNKLEFLYPDTLAGRPRWRNNIDPAQLDPDEKALVLGRYDGGELSLGEYLRNIVRVPEERRPDFDDYDSLAVVVFQMSLMDILTIEARSQGLDKSSAYLDKVTKFRELAMADLMRNDSIPGGIEITDEDLQEYFSTHPDEFTTPERFHLIEIQVAEQETAQRLKNSIRSEREFKQVAARETLRPGKKRVSGDLGIIYREQYPDLFDAAAKVTRGYISDPINVGGKWSIVWISQRLEPQVQDFEANRLFILEKLTKEEGDALYRGWIDDMKKRITIDIFDDILTESIDRSKYTEADSSQAG